MTQDVQPPSAEPQFVLHSPDGLLGTEGERGDLARLEDCEKIVLGDAARPRTGLVPNGIQSWPRGLKVLHLHGLSDLASLPPFDNCPDLETLDVRGCSSLTELPPLDPVPKLEWLDAEDCSALTRLPENPPPGLQFLFLGGCTGLDPWVIEEFLRALGSSESPRLVELDLSRTRTRRLPRFAWKGYWEPEPDPTADHEVRWASRRWLEKIVLQGCQELNGIDLPLSQLPNLQHLDVSGCARLQELPALPVVPAYPAPYPQKVLQYLRVDGTAIESHAGCSVRQSHRRESDDLLETRRNAADTFLTFQHFGDPVTFPECRVMVLGNSMAGKTNLVNRLFHGIPGDDPGGYIEPDGGRARWKPALGIETTHPIHCPTLLVDVEGFDVPATVHLWDYGGQHKYHRSHRTFVGEGTLFLLVWRHPKKSPSPEDERRERELRDDEPFAHTLEYWLDYVVACGVATPETLHEHVQIVVTQSGDFLDGEVEEAFQREIGKHARKGLSHRQVESVDLDPGPELARTRWHDFHAEFRGRIAAFIQRNGDRVPDFYGRVAKRIQRDRRLCEQERLAEDQRRNGLAPAGERMETDRFRALALPDGDQWRALLEDERGGPIERTHRDALTRTLHDAGSLFWLHPPGRPRDRFVIVDQALALDWVYRLFDSKKALGFQAGCRQSGGWFERKDLMADVDPGEDPRQLFPRGWEEDRALGILEQQRLVLREGERFLALEDVLLPDVGDVLLNVKRRRRDWERRSAARRQGLEGAVDRAIGQGVFQDFRAWFLGQLRSVLDLRATAHLYRGGFQIEVQREAHWNVRDPEHRGDWPERFLIEIFWLPIHSDGYGGTVHIYVHAEDDASADSLWGKLLGDDGMLRAAESPLGRDLRAVETGTTPFLILESAAKGVPVVGFSCRGSNEDAPRLNEHLWGLTPPHPAFYYRGEETLQQVSVDNTEHLLGRLGSSSLVVLFIDEAYLDPDASRNRYSMEELAMALFRYDPENIERLAKRLLKTDTELPDACEKRAFHFYRNARTAREQAPRRTVLYAPGIPQDVISKRLRAVLEGLADFLSKKCETLIVLDHPLWFLKRDLVRVLLEDGGLQRFNGDLGDTSSTIKDFETLRSRVEDLIQRLHD